MAIEPGTYALGPPEAELRIRTGRAGAAAKAGHDLLIEVTSWSATIEVAEPVGETRMSLTADSRSLRVRSGTGGMKALDEDDRDNIRQTIDDEVLKGTAIEFGSTSVRQAGSDLAVDGELKLSGVTHPVSFTLRERDGVIGAEAMIAQSEWGMKPYSALFGTLKVADQVAVELEGRPHPQSR